MNDMLMSEEQQREMKATVEERLALSERQAEVYRDLHRRALKAMQALAAERMATERKATPK